VLLRSVSLRAAVALSLAGLSFGCASETTDDGEEEPAVCENPGEPAPMPPCPEGWFHYVDTACPFPPGTPCMQIGDGLCHRPCDKDSDCVDPCRPTCDFIQLCNGSDACGTRVNVCKPPPATEG